MIQVLIDENLSEHLADGINSIQKPLDNGIEIISMQAVFGKGTKDENWLPDWGKRQGVFVTQDVNITRTRHLAELLSRHQLGAFFLKLPNKTPYWDRVKVLIKHWPEIAGIIGSMRKPYNYLVTTNKIEKM
jgi:hypothetical protein